MGRTGMTTARRTNTTRDAESGDATNRRRTSGRGGQPCTHAPPGSPGEQSAGATNLDETRVVAQQSTGLPADVGQASASRRGWQSASRAALASCLKPALKLSASIWLTVI